MELLEEMLSFYLSFSIIVKKTFILLFKIFIYKKYITLKKKTYLHYYRQPYFFVQS